MRLQVKIQRFIGIIIILLLAFNGLQADPVDKKTVKSVALNYFQALTGKSYTDEIIKKIDENFFNDNKTTYVVHFSKGWMILSADDNSKPILGYSTKSDFPEDSDHPLKSHMIEKFNRQINTTIVKNIINKSNQDKWREITNNKVNNLANPKTMYGPLLRENGEDYSWHQASPYNDYCPQATNTPHNMPAGCVAIAMGMIMRYYQHPYHGLGINTYNWDDENLSSSFSDSSYFWNRIPVNNEFNNQIEEREAAKVCYDIGISVNMNYANGGSGSTNEQTFNAFIDHFNYDNTMEWLDKGDYEDEEWIDIVSNEIQAGRPIYYSGRNSWFIPASDGHAFVVDGYNDLTNNFHINWGWGTEGNGFVTLDELIPVGDINDESWAHSEEAIIGIKPSEINLIYNQTLDDGPSYVPNQGMEYSIDVSYESNNSPAFNYETKIVIENETGSQISTTNSSEETNGLYTAFPPAPQGNGNYKVFSEVWTRHKDQNVKLLESQKIDFNVTGTSISYEQILEPNETIFNIEEPLTYTVNLENPNGSGATGYEVEYYISNIESNWVFESGNLNESNQNDGEYSINTNTPDNAGEYKIFAMIYYNSDLILSTNPIEFEVIETEVQRPTLLSPYDDQEHVSRTPNFEWSEVNGAESYDMAIYDRIDGNLQQIFFKGDLTSTEFQLPESEQLEYSEWYDWTARVTVDGNTSDWAVLSEFKVENYLDNPDLLFPSDQITNLSLTPIFKWKDVENADYYNLQIALDPSLDEGDETFSNIEDTQFEIPPDVLEENTQYYWSVRAYYEDGHSDYSEPYRFKVGGDVPPGPPELISPNNFATEISTKPTFEWESGSGVNHNYTIQISSESNFNEIVYEKEEIKNEVYVLPPNQLMGSTEYFWRVKGTNVSGDSEFSDIYSFNTFEGSLGPGDVIWELTTNRKVESLPVFDNEGDLYINISDTLTKINPTNGDKIFSKPEYAFLEDDQGPTISHDGETIYSIADDDAEGMNGVNGHSHLIAVDKYGNLIWKFDLSGKDVYSPALDSEGNIYLTVNDGRDQFDDKNFVISIDKNGNLRWRNQIYDYYEYRAKPVVSENMVYVARERDENEIGKIMAINTSNGELEWQYGLNEDEIEYNVPPALTNNQLIVTTTYDDMFYAFNKNNGNIISGWPFSSIDDFEATAVVDENGVIFNGTNEEDGETKLYALNANASIVWQKDILDDYEGQVLGDADILYCYDDSNLLYALNKDNGEEKWKVNFNKDFEEVMIGPNGTLYACAGNAEGEDHSSLFAINTASSGLLNSHWPSKSKDYGGTSCYDAPNMVYYPPYNISATKGEYQDKVLLSWETNTSWDSVQVFRKLSSENEYQYLENSNSANSFKDENIEVLEHYKYKLKCFKNEYNTNLIPSQGVEGWADFQTPYNCNATQGEYGDSVIVKWFSPAGEVESYEIQRSEQQFANYESISENVTDTFYVDSNPPNEKLWYRIRANFTDGSESKWSEEVQGWPIITEVKTNEIPVEYTLKQNYPNPFNPSTSIKFSLPERSFVNLKVFNSVGEEVKELVNKIMEQGYHRVNFNASNFSTGIYYYRIKANDFTDVKKMLLLK